MNNSIQKKWNNASVRVKMLSSFIIPIVLILFTNIYMYVSINATIEKVNTIFITNINLNEMSKELTNLQNSMREYLENKGTSALNSYYAADQNYKDALSNMSSQQSASSVAAMQENIINQSNNYFKVAQDTIQAKRGRNVEKYKASFEESEILCADIQNCIYSLNDLGVKSTLTQVTIFA